LDTTVFIYQLETSPRYQPLTGMVFSWLEQSGAAAVTSTITMTELLVRPYRENDEQWVDDYYALLSRYPNLRWIAPDMEIADLAARIRARHRLRTPDAILAATATVAGAPALITNDEIFERVETFETLVLERLLA
jgi:predicted nucleic acid-binding protein